MMSLRTILCPVDFSDSTPRQVALAAGVARLCQGRLVLHHNLAGLGLSTGVGWMWSADHQPALTPTEISTRLDALAKEHAPDVPVEVRITEGPAPTAVLLVSDDVNADLVVLSTHAVSDDEHTSVTGRVLERTHRSVLALHDAKLEKHALRLSPSPAGRQVALVPTDLTPESGAAVQFAFDLARLLPLDLHLLHLVPGGRPHHTNTEAFDALRALIPAGFEDRTHVHVLEGEPSAGIARAATDLGASCIVMGEHTRAPLRRWFSHDTSNGVLREAPCPVWYVPGVRAA